MLTKYEAVQPAILISKLVKIFCIFIFCRPEILPFHYMLCVFFFLYITYKHVRSTYPVYNVKVQRTRQNHGNSDCCESQNTYIKYLEAGLTVRVE